MKIQCSDLSPHLSPRRGYPLVSIRPLFIVVLSCFRCLAACPISVGFMARATLLYVDAALAKNLPHRSRENEFTAGRVYEFTTCKGHMSLTGFRTSF